MLVLSRKVDEAIVIEGGILIKVVSIARNRVQLGIEAPGREVLREELVQRREGGVT